MWLYPRIIVSKSHGNTSMYVDTVINFANYHIHTNTTYYVHTTYRISDHIVSFWTTFRRDKTSTRMILFYSNQTKFLFSHFNVDCWPIKLDRDTLFPICVVRFITLFVSVSPHDPLLMSTCACTIAKTLLLMQGCPVLTDTYKATLLSGLESLPNVRSFFDLPLNVWHGFNQITTLTVLYLQL